MDYSVSLLKTKADCEALINIATNEQGDLNYRKDGLLRQRQTATTTSVEIETELATVTVELSSLQTVLDTLPEGPTRVKVLQNFKKAEYKKFLLEQRKGSYGALSLLEKEFDIASIDLAITESSSFIAALQERMGQL